MGATRTRRRFEGGRRASKCRTPMAHGSRFLTLLNLSGNGHTDPFEFGRSLSSFPVTCLFGARRIVYRMVWIRLPMEDNVELSRGLGLGLAPHPIGASPSLWESLLWERTPFCQHSPYRQF